ncbi:MAG TPA: DUF1918 domain-containing protein [Actinophytocola sp.]|uniref:DUF1918 domain-containing protein n=1 Tax=Actinophytocola sp. TaxID=1872138 RepID=UPI002DB8659A|nr:DUF1918 domain-containing protein [Actinophytocola sp.]HEU5470792.1 DUF1918 domain-containing protein [Actinophytocola sp.]
MRAQSGDWLVIEAGDESRHARRGRIEQVRSAQGAPPYLVRWLDTGRTTLVFPGPDAHVLTAVELERIEATVTARCAAVQAEIGARYRR